MTRERVVLHDKWSLWKSHITVSSVGDLNVSTNY